MFSHPHSRPTYVATLMLAIAPAACSPQPTPAESADANFLSERRINTSVFDCAGTAGEPFEFVVRHGPGETALWLPLEFGRPYLVLSQVFEREEAANRYVEGDVEVSIDGATANLAVGSERFAGCIENPVRSVWEHAKLSGVDFRATGDNPAWYAEIRRGGELVFRTAWNDLRVAVATPEPEIERTAGLAVYHAQSDGRALTVEVGGMECPAPDRDDLSGTRVVVTLDGALFSGCGRALH